MDGGFHLFARVGRTRPRLRLLRGDGPAYGIRAITIPAIGRDPDDIEFAFDPGIIIRDEPQAALAVHQEQLARHLQPAVDGTRLRLRSGQDRPTPSLNDGRPYLDLGFRHLICDLPAPYDLQTVERLPEVRAMIGA